jgi:hypothetical protein
MVDPVACPTSIGFLNPWDSPCTANYQLFSPCKSLEISKKMGMVDPIVFETLMDI